MSRSRVWCADGAAWSRGVVVGDSSGTQQVQLLHRAHTNDEKSAQPVIVDAAASACLLANKKADEDYGIPDVMDLEFAHEAAVVNNIIVGFEQGRQFSMGGECLFSCTSVADCASNAASKPDELYSEELKAKYQRHFAQKHMLDKLPAHRRCTACVI